LTVRIALELESGVDPPEGRVMDDIGEARRFSGWAGLSLAVMLALDQAEEAKGVDRRGRWTSNPIMTRHADSQSSAASMRGS
jgi:hypothetical protein